MADPTKVGHLLEAMKLLTNHLTDEEVSDISKVLSRTLIRLSKGGREKHDET